MERPLDELEARFFDYHAALGHSPATINHYADSLKNLRKWLGATDRPTDTSSLTTASLEQFSIWLQETPTNGWRGSTQRSPHGRYGIMKDIKAFVRFLLDEELVDHNIKVKLPKLPQTLFPVLSKDEVETIWQTPQLTYPGAMGKRNRAIVALMLDTGLRRGEVVGLQPSDIDLDDQLVTVIGKGSKQRRVPFSTTVKHLLDEWLRARGGDPGSVFMLSDQGLRQLFRRIQQDTGIANFYPHACRHTAATSMVRANMDIHSVERVLGHSSLVVTERYLSLSDADLRAKHAAASPFDALVSTSSEPPTSRRKRPSRFE